MYKYKFKWRTKAPVGAFRGGVVIAKNAKEARHIMYAQVRKEKEYCKELSKTRRKRKCPVLDRMTSGKEWLDKTKTTFKRREIISHSISLDEMRMQ